MADPTLSPPVLVLRQRPDGCGAAWARGLEVYTAEGRWVGSLIGYDPVADSEAQIEIKIRMNKCWITTGEPSLKPAA